MGTLEVVTHICAKTTQNIRHKRRAAKHCAQRLKHIIFQSPDAPYPQMHSAPFGIYARCHIIPVYVTTHEEFDDHHPKQAGEGKDKGDKKHQEANNNELPEMSGHEELADFSKAHEPQKAY